MLEKARRIRKKEEFTRVFRSGKPLFFKEYGCRILKNNLPFNRLGFSFGKKQLPLATERNRARRSLVASYQQEQSSFPQGYDMIFFASKKPEKIEKETFQQFIQFLKLKLS